MKRTSLAAFCLGLSCGVAANASGRIASLDTLTAFSFSQGGAGDAADPQVLRLAPELNLRTWNCWKAYGSTIADYNAAQISAYHARGILLEGGLTASVVFREDAPSDSAFLDWISRDALNDTVSYDQIQPGARRANIASEGFRRHLVELAKVQIDLGVDGLFFDEVNAGFEGSDKWTWNGNEGFDDAHLRAFNRYLLALHPDWTRERFRAAFRMDSTNVLDPAVSPDSLGRNFNYRAYLSAHGWETHPLISANPLAKIWGRSVQNRMRKTGTNFVEASTTAWWGEIVDSVRAYAAAKGRVIHITSNGIVPFVDFNSIGLYDYNQDTAGKQVDYVPTTASGGLDGSRSLQAAFRSLRERSLSESDSVPTVLFLDWPTGFMNSYYAFSKRQKLDYWKIYGAEGFANGLIWAFHLRTAMGGDPTAASMGILDSLGRLMNFYRTHATLYHHVAWPEVAVAAPSGIAATISWQASTHRLFLHLVNHNYRDSLLSQTGLAVTFPLSAAPLSVDAWTPDSGEVRSAQTSWSEGQLFVTLDRLDSYAVVALTLPEGILPADIGHRSSKAVPEGCCVTRSGNALRWRAQGRSLDGRR